VKSGFLPSELDIWAPKIADAIAQGAITGITVRHEADEPLLPVALAAQQFAETNECHVLISIKLAGPVVSQERTGDHANAVSAAQAMILSRCLDRCAFIFDTFMDVDRGYYPRHAFIDGRFNARAPAIVFTTLNALLSSDSSLRFDAVNSTAQKLCFGYENTNYELVSGEAIELNSLVDASKTVIDLLDHPQLKGAADIDNNLGCRLLHWPEST